MYIFIINLLQDNTFYQRIAEMSYFVLEMRFIMSCPAISIDLHERPRGCSRRDYLSQKLDVVKCFVRETGSPCLIKVVLFPSDIKNAKAYHNLEIISSSATSGELIRITFLVTPEDAKAQPYKIALKLTVGQAQALH